MRVCLGFVAVTVLVALHGCTECDWGGPGCGRPQLVGMCDTALAVETDYILAGAYNDDSATYATDLLQASVVDGTAEAELQDGRLHLRAEGGDQVVIEALIDGWEDAATWTFDVVDVADVDQDCEQARRVWNEEERMSLSLVAQPDE